MEENYIKILDSFNFDQFTTTRQIKSRLKKSNHIEAIKIMKEFNIAQSYDYLRACGKSNFTDFALRKLEDIIQDDSKYIISRNINGKITYLYTKKLAEKLEEMRYLVNKGYFDTIKSDNKKIKGYFENENEIIIGKKSTGKINIILEEANINTIATHKYYLFDKNHLVIQAQLAALGVYFGYMSKISRDDKNKGIYNKKFNEIFIATIKDVNISELSCEKTLRDIDYIDVIWVGNAINDLTVAIEVEIKRDWDQTVNRLYSLTLASSTPEKVVNIIVSEKEDDYYTIRRNVNYDVINVLRKKFNLAHISFQNLVKILKMRDSGINKELIKRKFFKEIRYI